MIRTKIVRCVISAALLLAVNYCHAQAPEEIEKLFPGKLAVFSNVNRKVEISYRNGLPYAESNEITDMIVLNDKANNVYNKDKVYHSSFNELKKIEAYTLVPDGGGTKKIRVVDFKTQSSAGENIFFDDSKETEFNYPKLQKGSVAHIETDFYSADARFMMPFYFSSYLPVYKAGYSITFPEDMEVKYIIKNDDKKAITVIESTKGKRKKLEFTANSIPNYEYFSDGASIPYSAPHVIVYISNYQNDKKRVGVFSTLEDLYRWNAGFLKNINTNPDAALKEITDSICAGKKTEAEKAAGIYRWVQDHIKYVAFEQGLEGFIPRQAADVCSKRYGDCKDMASLLTAMLNAGGIEAHFTWIGTRSIPYSYSEVPLPITDNHMISAALIDHQWVFFDATDPNCIYGFPTYSIQDKEALISISPDKYELIKVPIVAAAKNSIVDSTILNITGNILSGKATVSFRGYAGAEIYDNLLYNKGEDEKAYVRKKLSRGSNKFIMKNYGISFTDTERKELVIKADFDIPDYLKAAGNEMYINLNPAKLINVLPIDTGTRRVSIENDYLYTSSQTHVLVIPENYTAAYIPKNLDVSNELFSFSLEYNYRDGKIFSTQRFEQKKLYILPKDFIEWNIALARVIPAYKEQVVLKKK